MKCGFVWGRHKEHTCERTPHIEYQRDDYCHCACGVSRGYAKHWSDKLTISGAVLIIGAFVGLLISIWLFDKTSIVYRRIVGYVFALCIGGGYTAVISAQFIRERFLRSIRTYK